MFVTTMRENIRQKKKKMIIMLDEEKYLLQSLLQWQTAREETKK